MKQNYLLLGSRLILSTLLFLLCQNVFSQDLTITGKVMDEQSGSSLPGASVTLKGSTSIGVTTDADGKYSIKVPSSAQSIVISFIGYTAKEVAIGNRSVIDIALTSDVSALEEVIVTGYGSQSKRDITGSVTTVNAKDLQSVPATTFAQQLQGRASGLNIVNDATPGGNATVRIRGFGTIGNNDPLFIIDGVPTENQGNLNPNDIETIQILKDASSASIYGSRAANGVVIITTKRGKIGKPVISFNAYYGTQKTYKDAEALNAEELGKYLFLADKYAGKTPSHGQYTFGPNGEVTIPDYVFPSKGKEGTAEVDPSKYSLVPGNIYAITKSADTDWWNELTTTAPIQNYQISASGGTENSRYALSIGYFSQDGVVKFIGYDRYTIRANTEFSALGKKLRVGENLAVSFDNRKGGFGNNQEQNAVSGSYKHHPLLPVYDIAGNFAGSRGANLGNNSNPYATLYREKDNTTYRLRAFGNVYGEFDIIPNLTIKTSLGIDGVSQRGRYIGRANPEYVEGSFNNGSTSTDYYSYQWVWTNTLSYSRNFGTNHKVDAYIGMEAIREFAEEFGAARSGYAFEIPSIINYLNLGDATKATNFGGVNRDYSLYSQFGKVNYAYADKYLLQFILRNDASSRFQAASRSALFPAFSVGWRLSEENFMKEFGFINDLKIRYGWGRTGNQKIGDYNAFTTYRADIFHAGYPIDGSPSQPTIGYDASSFGNPNAKWETTTSNNLGLDATFLNDALTFEIDFWNRKTADMLFSTPITFTAGDANAPSFNVGAMTNKGIDLGISYRNTLLKGDFRYGLSMNYSMYRNTVDKLDESANTKYFGAGSRVPAVTLTQAGLPLSSYYGYKVLGIFQSDEEAKAWAPYEKYNKAGKFKMADINGDGKITDDDRTVIGNPHPDFVYGVNLNLGYKAFDLTVFGNGVVGNEIFNYLRYFTDFNTFQGNRAKRALYDAWQPDHKEGTVPIMDADDQISSRPSSYLVEKGTYFRLKNVQLTYTLPKVASAKIGFSNAQIYVQGQNMLTVTKYTGLNPEVQSNSQPGQDNTLGFDGGFMPVSRTFLVGLNFSF
ncbi:SusC/RagA family TonB-linked outer membrane protein [Dyadobacter psychrophilus]|uniref:TonB-linked outer membrane protein, SusC/RagA family n=1 Tax=Dyadobacter psychrophilus TaxID=651661 RepID=A0A1T5C8I0_9BACT|nr:TonB-dependent receptor [Dyadobacter psychrophilus]SKB55430.1 TonB-linked outer membrane protein, SusC/RagA family [Dyadobacter psychrophilus]